MTLNHGIVRGILGLVFVLFIVGSTLWRSDSPAPPDPLAAYDRRMTTFFLTVDPALQRIEADVAALQRTPSLIRDPAWREACLARLDATLTQLDQFPHDVVVDVPLSRQEEWSRLYQGANAYAKWMTNMRTDLASDNWWLAMYWVHRHADDTWDWRRARAIICGRIACPTPTPQGSSMQDQLPPPA